MSCPAREELTGFALGLLSDQQVETIGSHLETCVSCQGVVMTAGWSSDVVLANIRQAQAADLHYADEPQAAAVLARAAAILGESGPPLGGELVRRGTASDDPSSKSDPPADPPPDLGTIREYRLLEKLGQGGMGAVYKALHTRLRRTVALKVLPADRVRDQEAVARFDREMEAVGRLDHPHIVRAMDAGEADGQHFLVMEYVAGQDLSRLAEALGPLPIADACELVRQAAVGLQHVHEHGLVHRDIKPSNLMLTTPLSPGGRGVGGEGARPTVKILDLGLALLQDAGGRELTNSGQVMGTLDYMAPEQGGGGHAVDIRADIYSLGATLYKLLAGSPPFDSQRRQTPIQKLMALATQPPPPLSDRRPDVPARLAELVHRLLAKDPADRPSTPAALAAALAPFCVGADLAKLAGELARRAPAAEGGESRVEGQPVGNALRGVPALSPSPFAGEGRGEGAVTAPTEAAPGTDPHLSNSLTGTTPSVPSDSPAPALDSRPSALDSPSPSPSPRAAWGRAGVGGLLRRTPRAIRIALAAAAAILLLAVIIVRLKTADGTLVLTVNDSRAEVRIDGEKVAVTRSADGKLLTISVDPGTHTLVVTTPDGLTFKAPDKFELSANGQLQLAATLEPPAVAGTTPPALDPPPSTLSPLADREKPFALLHADGRREEFKSAGSAFATMQDGDTLEVHGNGPFPLGQVQLQGTNGFTLRAAPGYRPRFVHTDTPSVWFDVTAPWQVEGCDFLAEHGTKVFTLRSGRGELTGCRIFGTDITALVVEGDCSIRVADCLIVAPTGWGTSSFQGATGTVEFVNNVVFSLKDGGGGSGGLIGAVPGERFAPSLRDNTLYCGAVLGTQAVEGSISLAADGNLFRRSGAYLDMMGCHVDTWEEFRKLLQWEGSSNLYAASELWLRRGNNPPGEFFRGNLAEWNQFWGREESGSVQEPEVYFAWDVARLLPPDDLVPILRERVESVAKSKGADAVGPEWDLIGPGDAYVKSLRVAGMQLADSALRPEPPEGGPFTLVRAGQIVRGFVRLDEAINAAQDADVIEIRGDGPYPGADVGGSGRALTVRAAPGYQPVILVGLRTEGPSDAWTLEGLHFRAAEAGYKHHYLWGSPYVRISRMANCAFEGRESDVFPGGASVDGSKYIQISAGPAAPVEIVNCLIPGAMTTILSPGNQWQITNSIIGYLPLQTTAPGEARIELDRCLFWNPLGGAIQLSSSHAFKCSVTARRTFFETGIRLFYLSLPGQEQTAQGDWKWMGEGNVYAVGHFPWTDSDWHDGTMGLGLETLRERWHSPEEGSVAVDPIVYDPLWWRLLPGSPGYRARPDGRDYGADVTRIARTAEEADANAITAQPAPVSPADPDRAAAEWVLSLKGSLTIETDGQERQINDVASLPEGDFHVVAVELAPSPGVKNQDVTDNGLSMLAALTQLRHLDLASTPITDAGLAKLEGQNGLSYLNLNGTSITDAGLEHLKGLTNLTHLAMSCQRITDSGLECVASLTKLTDMDLHGVHVSDGGLKSFRNLRSLRILWLRDTQIAVAGFLELRKMLPNCKIDWSTAATPILADLDKPFVLLHADGRREEFQSAGPAFATMQDGDTLEVYGNGPFPLGNVVLQGTKGFTLRAAAGYRPRFLYTGPSGGGWFNVTAPWSAEGCDFLADTNCAYFSLRSSRGELSRCRIFGSGIAALAVAGDCSIRVADCLIVAPNALTKTFDFGGNTGTVELVNNVVFNLQDGGYGLLIAAYAGERFATSLRDNTFYCGTVLGTQATEGTIRLAADGNLFRGVSWQMSCGAENAETFRNRMQWVGSGNFYTSGELSLGHPSGLFQFHGSLAERNQFWGREEPGSIQERGIL